MSAAVIDAASGTAYAFEVDDARHDDVSIVIVCNAALGNLCYRLVPHDIATIEELRTIRAVIESTRVDRAGH